MEDIVIKKDGDYGFDVWQGDKHSDHLGFDEMLGLISALTILKKDHVFNGCAQKKNGGNGVLLWMMQLAKKMTQNLSKWQLLLLKHNQRAKPRHVESGIQQAVVQWFRLQYPRYIIAAIPNGGFRNAKEATIMKREGILAGFSDLIIIAEHNVLFLEVKTPDGRLSEKQKEFQRKVCALGFEYMVCRSFDESALAIERWLKVISMK